MSLAAFMPSMVVAYFVFGLFIATVELFAQPGIAPALVQGPELIAQAVFTALLATWSIWVRIAVSARSRDPRTAAQLSLLVSLPTVAVTSLVTFNVIPATLAVTISFAAGMLFLDRLGWRLASAIFDRERLITSTKWPPGAAQSARASVNRPSDAHR